MIRREIETQRNRGGREIADDDATIFSMKAFQFSNGQVANTERTSDRRHRSRKIVDEEREKYKAKNGSLQNTSKDLKETNFVILNNQASAPIQKERLSSTSKARRKTCRNGLVKKGGMPDTVKSFREIDSSKKRREPGLGLSNPVACERVLLCKRILSGKR